jgi:hypothetical protein
MDKLIPEAQKGLELTRTFSLTQEEAHAIALPRAIPWPQGTGISSFPRETPIDQVTMDSLDA